MIRLCFNDNLFKQEERVLMAKEALEFITSQMKVYELLKMSNLSEITLKDNEKAFYITYNTEDIDQSEFIFYDV